VLWTAFFQRSRHRVESEFNRRVAHHLCVDVANDATGYERTAPRSLCPTSLPRNGAPSYSEEPGMEILQHGEARIRIEPIPGWLCQPLGICAWCSALSSLHRAVRDLTGSVYGRRMYNVMRYWDEDHPEWTPEYRDFTAAWPRRPPAAAQPCGQRSNWRGRDQVNVRSCLIIDSPEGLRRRARAALGQTRPSDRNRARSVHLLIADWR
jgi:hypothetical protein